MIFNLLEIGIMAFIFGFILFLIIFTIKNSGNHTEEEKAELSNRQKSLFIKCFLITFAFFAIVLNMQSSSSSYHSNYKPKIQSSSHSSSSNHASYSSSSSNSYDEGYDDYYENGDYDQDRYDWDSSYADGVDDAMEDEY